MKIINRLIGSIDSLAQGSPGLFRVTTRVVLLSFIVACLTFLSHRGKNAPTTFDAIAIVFFALTGAVMVLYYPSGEKADAPPNE